MLNASDDGYQPDKTKTNVDEALGQNKYAAFLKNEEVPLDEEEVRLTLSASLKYGKDDITIVDWDGAFIFDAEGDFLAGNGGWVNCRWVGHAWSGHVRIGNR